MRATSAALLAVAALASAGCAEIRLRTTPQIVDETVLETRRETVIGPPVTADVEQSGSRVTLVASRSCSDHSLRNVRRTMRYAHYDANAAGTRRMGIAGGVLAAMGGLLSALPAMPVKTDHGADLGIGIPTAVLGTSLAVAAIVGVARAASRDEVVDVSTVDDGAVSESRPCDRQHAAVLATVLGRVAGTKTDPLALGKTDEDGKLEIDLARIPEAAVKAAPAPKKLLLYVDEIAVGAVSLAALEHEADERAWAEAGIDDGGCAAPLPGTACWRLRRYLDDFPDGVHVSEARAAIDQHKDRVQADIKAARARAQARERLRAQEARREAVVGAASTAARRAAAATCKVTCGARCNGDAACAEACAAQSCEAMFLRQGQAP